MGSDSFFLDTTGISFSGLVYIHCLTNLGLVQFSSTTVTRQFKNHTSRDSSISENWIDEL